MTRIYTFGMEQIKEKEGCYLVVLVAHRDGRRASRAALAEAAKRGGKWRVAHRAERRTGIRIPMGEILGSSEPITFALE